MYGASPRHGEMMADNVDFFSLAGLKDPFLGTVILS